MEGVVEIKVPEIEGLYETFAEMTVHCVEAGTHS